MHIIGIRYDMEMYDGSIRTVEYSIIDNSKFKANIILSIHLEILSKIKCISNIEVYL